jgi:hypothetical protein
MAAFLDCSLSVSVDFCVAARLAIAAPEVAGNVIPAVLKRPRAV